LELAIHERKRLLTLIYAYYLAELLNQQERPHQAWKEWRKMTNRYIWEGTKRMYQLYEGNLSQLYATEETSLGLFRRISKGDFERLLTLRCSTEFASYVGANVSEDPGATAEP
jgi:hypothetical protein